MKSAAREKQAVQNYSQKPIFKYEHMVNPTHVSFKNRQFTMVEKDFSNDGKSLWKERLILLASGAVIGTLNGFFGGGGGMVCVPILEKVLKLDNKHAHATAIAVILPLSLISAFIYVFNGYIQTFPLLVIGGGVIAGGILGSFALKFLPPKAVRIIFAIIMFAGGIKLIL